MVLVELLDAWFFLFPANVDSVDCAVRKRRRTQRGKVLPLIQDRLNDAEF